MSLVATRVRTRKVKEDRGRTHIDFRNAAISGEGGNRMGSGRKPGGISNVSNTVYLA